MAFWKRLLLRTFLGDSILLSDIVVRETRNSVCYTLPDEEGTEREKTSSMLVDAARLLTLRKLFQYSRGPGGTI